MPDFVLVALSFVVGILVGFTSMGGAALMTPLLILGLGMKPVLAVGTDLIYSSITKLVGGTVHWKQGNVDFQVVARMASASVPMGLLGVATSELLRWAGRNPDVALKQAIGVTLLVVATLAVLRAAGVGPSDRFAAWVRAHERSATLVWSGVVGFTVGLTSVGSGSLIAPFLLLLFYTNPARAVGTDVAHAALLSTATGLLHWKSGNVNWHMVPLLLCGSIPGVICGSWLAPRMPIPVLKLGVNVILFVTGWQLVVR